MADYPPEDHYGNIEYKRSLVDKSDNRIACIATQMRMRLHEGHGEAIYVIGVDDDGSIVGVNDDEFTESFNNLTIAADTNTYSMTMLTSKDVPKTKKKVYEILVRENNEQKYIDIKIAVAGNVDSGKCEKKGTKIKLYSGQNKNVEDITTKDVLMGDDSTPRHVLETTKGFGQLYSIIPINGEPLNVNKNHILCFQCSNYNYVYWDKSRERYGVRHIIYEKSLPKLKTTFFPLQRESRKFYRKGMKFYETDKEACAAANEFLEKLKENKDSIQYKDIVELNLGQYLDLNKGTQSALKLYRVPVSYSKQDVVLDPYMLGYWLGDGTSSQPEITTADNEIVEYFKKHCDIITKSHKYRYGIRSYGKTAKGCNEFLNLLRKYNVLNNKHIPDVYKHNTREVRLAVIAGLIDSDGHLGRNGGYDFNMTRKNEKLCDDMIEVIRSLGFASYKRYNTKTCTNGKNGPVKCECIGFGIDGEGIEEFPVLLSRKKSDPRKSPKNVLVTGIKDIKILPDQEYYGFELDGNNRYLHDDFTVTHNSSLLGVLTSGQNDDGRGKARLSIFNFKHEVYTGRTSSIAHHILGFDDKGQVMNYSGTNIHKKGWPEIVKDSSKIISFFDLCGHEKYLRTTILGLTSSFPDLCLILVGANMGLSRMTQEHIFLCVTLKIPFAIVLTKIDICANRQNILKETITNINRLMKMPGLRRIPYKITNMDDVIICAKNVKTESVVPIFHVSNVTGMGINFLKQFLNLLGKSPSNIKDDTNDVEMHLDTTFTVPGVGTVVGGQLISGIIKVNDKLMLGPNEGKFVEVQVRSIHCKRTPLQEVGYGSYVCLGLKKIDRKTIRRGNVIISKDSPQIAVNEFDADITVLKSHSTTVKPGYEPVIHTCTMRQSAKIISITNKINARDTKNDDNDYILRTGDKAIVRFRFSYRPEYIKSGSRLLLSDGTVKIIGVVK
uniref:DOD-type homing endonuclease domain-containing protein n=1 Tax=viral metagenome TaxID=1070528 RepID=A0A6C0JR65_9ZZZZ